MYSPMMKKKKKTLAEALSGLHSYISKGFKTPEGKSRLGESIKKAKSGLEGVIGKGGTLEKAMKRKKKVTRTFHPKKKDVINFTKNYNKAIKTGKMTKGLKGKIKKK